MIGYLVFSDEEIVNKIENSCHLLLGIGLVATILTLYMFIWIDKEFALFNTITKYVSEYRFYVFWRGQNLLTNLSDAWKSYIYTQKSEVFNE